MLVQAALVRAQRSAWIAFGLGLLLLDGGDLFWTLVYTDAAKVPYPSPADAGYLAALPCFYAGIALLIKQRIGHFTARQLARWGHRRASPPRLSACPARARAGRV